MSRFGEGELFCAMCSPQPVVKATPTRQMRHIAQGNRSGCIRQFHCNPPKRKHPFARSERVLRNFTWDRLRRADHGRAEKAQDLADRIRDRGTAATREEQAYRARIGRHVLHHERTGVAACQELASVIRGHDLAGKRLRESSAAGAFVLVGDADRRVQASDLGCGSTRWCGRSFSPADSSRRRWSATRSFQSQGWRRQFGPCRELPPRLRNRHCWRGGSFS